MYYWSKKKGEFQQILGKFRKSRTQKNLKCRIFKKKYGNIRKSQRKLKKIANLKKSILKKIRKSQKDSRISKNVGNFEHLDN